MKKIFAIRHAESAGNAGLATQDPGSNPLTERGHQQAKEAVQAVVDIMKPELFIVSKYIRTQQTLEPLRKRFNDVPVEIWDIHEFCLLNPLRYCNTTQAQRKPHILGYWAKNDPGYCDGGEAESFIGFMTRIEDTVSALRAHPAKNIVIVSHELFLHGVKLLKEHTNFEPFKDKDAFFQKKFMRDYRLHCDACRVPNATPYLLEL